MNSTIEKCALIAEREPEYPDLTPEWAVRLLHQAYDVGRNDYTQGEALVNLIRLTCKMTKESIASAIRSEML